ncbi:hypothetical protein LNKW23_00370 [Paralimibaculum aggregatum]|uniref:DUF3035 domain-containing protein n=1 Tax=Paralimibaculum aggregatum TaxID=3036245 RepID=A0ABQ6LF11_9RHOB|nr:hypothetical protein [Limibaculum sp. NKW23]GMG80825.1 hypothetical protein LNKW23_00370 [Limibaculum sp. NKW23]
MKRFGAAHGVAAALVLALAGCESFRLFNEYQVVESPEVEATPWPLLVDVPPAPPPGTYTAAVPDPAGGIAVQTELSLASESAGPKAARLAPPVLSEAERKALAAADPRRDRRTAEARRPPLTPAERAALVEAEAAQRARRRAAEAQAAADGAETE